ncbi:hypothetical protein IV203_021045 [Nitzschia inconspicua]|uniref:Uncharacterized protein n=1 Tax=Nitzschia inconspicua TaxID=303405 RepID=A0A9K3KGD6_9STRA|nr:hypothetical protein IV203_021045 [Nitzschia inconspicua]
MINSDASFIKPGKSLSHGNILQSSARNRVADQTGIADGQVATPTRNLHYRRRTMGLDVLLRGSDQCSAHYNSIPSFPRTNSIPNNMKSSRRGSGDGFLSGSSSSSPPGRLRRSHTPTSHRAHRTCNVSSAASIVQRSGSKRIKTTLLDIACWCSIEHKDAEETLTRLMVALELLKEHAVDSYYQVILRKYQGIETLRLASTTFPTPEVLGLVNITLKLLETDDATEVSTTPSNSGGFVAEAPVDGMVIDLSALSPTSVTDDMLAEQNTTA